MIGRAPSSGIQFSFGPYELDPRNRVLKRDGEALGVEPKVLEFLTYLVAQRHRLVTHEELRQNLWPGVVVAQASLGRLAKEARKLVGDTGDLQHTICTRRGYGYQFVAATRTSIQELTGTAGAPGQLESAVSSEPEPDAADTTVVESGDGALSLAIHWLVPREFTVKLKHGHALVIGRVEGCDLRLPGQSLSRRHAQLVPDGPVWLLDDLNSRNGTFVNGLRSQRAALNPGDLLRLGDWVGVVETARVAEGPPFHSIARKLMGGPMLQQALAPAWQMTDGKHPLNISGPSGAGKRATAIAVHNHSGRVGAVVEVRCGNIVAASSATSAAQSPNLRTLNHYFTEAARGTLLLHHVSELSVAAQGELAGLLRTPSHGDQNPCCISTSLMPLAECVGRGILGADLYDVLHALEVRVPSLQQRASDIPRLFRHFLTEHSAERAPMLSSRLIERLCLYDWPTNVRELRAFAREIALTRQQAAKLDVDCLPAWIDRSGGSASISGQRASVT